MRAIGCFLLIVPAAFYSAQTNGEQRHLDSLNRVIQIAAHDTAVVHAYLGLTAILQAAHLDTIVPLCGAAKRIAERNLARKDLSEAERLSFSLSLADALNYLATWEMYSGSVERAHAEYQQALGLARELGDAQLTGQVLSNLGQAVWTAGDLDGAILYFDSAVVVHERIGYDQGVVISRSNIAFIHKLKGRLALALSTFTSLLEKQRALGDEQGIANSLLNLGEIQFKLNEHQESADAYLKALTTFEKLNDERSMAIVYSSLGGVYEHMGEIEKAIAYLNEALLIQTRSNFRVDAGVSHSNLGTLYSRLGKMSLALEELNRSVELFRETGADQNLANSLSSIGMIHVNAGRIAEAEHCGKESLMLAQKVKLPYEIAGAAELMSLVYQRKGEWQQALTMELLLKTMQDSLVNDKNKTAATEARIIFKYDQKAFADSLKQSEAKQLTDARIAAQEARLKSERIQRYALFGGLVLSVVFGAIVFERFRTTRRQKQEIDLQRRKVEQLMNTRSNLVQTLSHSIRNPLTIISMAIGSAGAENRSTNGESRRIERMEKGMEQITRRLDYLDTVARLEQGSMRLNVQPVDLRQKLEDMVNNYAPKVEKKGMKVRADINWNNDPVSMDWSQLEMAVENLLDNAIKYNDAGTTIHVSLALEERGSGKQLIDLSVADDGRGINKADQENLKQFGFRGTRQATDAVPGTGIGLYHVDQVVQLHGGTFTVTSVEGRGSEFRISIPLLNEQEQMAIGTNQDMRS